MITDLRQIFGGLEWPASGNLNELLERKEGQEIPLANMALYLFHAPRPLLAIVSSFRDEDFGGVVDGVEFIHRHLSSYQQFTEEGYSGYPKEEYPEEQVAYLLTYSRALLDMAEIAYDASISSQVVTEVAASPNITQALGGIISEGIDVRQNDLIAQTGVTAQQLAWMANRDLIRRAYGSRKDSIWVNLGPKGVATYQAAIAGNG